MGFERKEKERRNRRILRVRKKLKSSDLPKVSVFRSLNHIYAQLVDTAKGITIASCSSLTLKKSDSKNKVTGSKKEIARSVGIELAKMAKEKGINAVIFDRGQFLYHGRVKEVSEGLREGGLQV